MTTKEEMQEEIRRRIMALPVEDQLWGAKMILVETLTDGVPTPDGFLRRLDSIERDYGISILKRAVSWQQADFVETIEKMGEIIDSNEETKAQLEAWYRSRE